ncbi:MAG: thiolase family protein [Solirubrobacterales bacterium]
MTIAIVGVGETQYRMRDGRPVETLVLEAVRRALDDAGLEPADVDGFALEGHSMSRRVRADELSPRMGLRDRAFTAQSSLAGAGVVGAAQLAELAIDAGLASVVVSYYGTSLSSTVGGPYSHHAADPRKAAFEMPFGFYGQPVYFAMLAQRYAHEYGLEPEQTGAVAVAARAMAARTPGAIQQEPMTIDDYLASPFVAEPLRKPDCCLINDGGVAFVMTSLERARSLRRAPVVLAGAGFASSSVSETDFFSQNREYLTTAARASGARAFRRAGLTPADVDVAEIYDCFTVSTILQLEDLGFVAKGEGAAAAADGLIGPDGALPVNTHGGLLSQSFMVGANHVVEAVRQLRGERAAGQIEGAEVVLVAGLGAQDHATAILTKDR